MFASPAAVKKIPHRVYRWSQSACERRLREATAGGRGILHLGCCRKFPVVDVRAIAKSVTPLLRNRQREARDALDRVASSTVAHQVRQAFATSSVKQAASLCDRHGANSPNPKERETEEQPELLVGVETVPVDKRTAETYPGVLVAHVDMRQVEEARRAVVRASHASDVCGASEIFDVLLVDACSPFDVVTAAGGTQTAAVLVGSSSASLVSRHRSTNFGGALVLANGNCPTPRVVVDPLRAALSVGLPLLHRDGIAVCRLLFSSPERSPSITDSAAESVRRNLRDLRHSFRHVQLFHDYVGLIAVAQGGAPGGSGGGGIREDFPGFLRGKPRPKSWSREELYREKPKDFFRAVRPEFTGAPQPEHIQLSLQLKKQRAEEQAERERVYQAFVSSMLDEFELDGERRA